MLIHEFTILGSPLREKVSQAILQLGESGVLHQLEEKWWPKPNCNEIDRKPQVQLMNFAGPLTILIIGVVFSIFIAVVERILHHRRSHRGFFRVNISTNLIFHQERQPFLKIYNFFFMFLFQTATEPGNGKIAMNGCDSESN